VVSAGHAAPRGAAPRGTRGASGGVKAAAAEAIAATTPKTMLAAVIAAGAAVLGRGRRRGAPAPVLIAPLRALASSNTAPGRLLRVPPRRKTLSKPVEEQKCGNPGISEFCRSKKERRGGRLLTKRAEEQAVPTPPHHVRAHPAATPPARVRSTPARRRGGVWTRSFGPLPSGRPIVGLLRPPQGAHSLRRQGRGPRRARARPARERPPAVGRAAGCVQAAARSGSAWPAGAWSWAVRACVCRARASRRTADMAGRDAPALPAARALPSTPGLTSPPRSIRPSRPSQCVRVRGRAHERTHSRRARSPRVVMLGRTLRRSCIIAATAVAAASLGEVSRLAPAHACALNPSPECASRTRNTDNKDT